MSKKKVVIALGHRALGTTMPEQYKATRNTAKAIADLVEAGADVVISHSNAPQVGMIHTAMNEYSRKSGFGQQSTYSSVEFFRKAFGSFTCNGFKAGCV